ncbi:hypothetical protein [Alistipes sp.]|uniref:hypothetical protein n=1 Tax=Alistipes sp. TaxID=1872444 RepID=UPI003AF49A43
MVKTISEKSVNTINARCRNGFRFDLQRFVERGEKQFCRSITLKENERRIKLTLWWRNEVLSNKDECGYTTRIHTGNVIPELHCAVWHKCENSPLWVSHGFGECHPFSEHPSPRRLMSALADTSALVTDKLILSLLPECERTECRQLLSNQKQAE